MKTLILAVLMTSLLPLSTGAAELKGVSMPDEVTVAGKVLKLNGLGMREATIFRVNVYVGALYLEVPTQDDKEVISSNQIKRVVLHFVRNVDSSDIRDAWKDGIENNCGTDCKSYEADLARLLAFFDQDIKKGDEMTFTLYPTKLEIDTGTGKTSEIANGEFGRVMLMSWIGPNPPNASLKEGMLKGKP